MELKDYASLKVKYKFTNECNETTTIEQNFSEIDENELPHKLVQSANSLMLSAGYNAPLSDIPQVIEWSLVKYNRFPIKEEIGHKFLITPIDPDESIDVAVWNGKTFDGYDNEEILAWAYMPARYDDTQCWY